MSENLYSWYNKFLLVQGLRNKVTPAYTRAFNLVIRQLNFLQDLCKHFVYNLFFSAWFLNISYPLFLLIFGGEYFSKIVFRNFH